MKLKETISKKRAMLNVVEEVVSQVESSRKWSVDNLNEAQASLEEFKTEHAEDDKDSYSYRSQIEYRTGDIDLYREKIAAYDAVIKALEKLI